MGEYKDLTGLSFGSLTVLEKTAERQYRYNVWLCRCECGREVTVSTKNLTSGRTYHCGCRAGERRNAHVKPKDRTGIRCGALTPLRMTGKSDKGAFLWECECECGRRVTVQAGQLQNYLVSDCGCGAGNKPKYKNIAGRRTGKLTALYPTAERDTRGCVIWHCRCDCGNETEISESDFMYGGYVSCGCVRKQRMESNQLSESLTFVDGTCVEWLKKRKNRSDNTSGFRGVYKQGESEYRAYIGLQRKKYYLGMYSSLEEAVSVRLTVEKGLHDGFLTCWQLWCRKAAEDGQWAQNNPFVFSVEKNDRTFSISSPVTERSCFRY